MNVLNRIVEDHEHQRRLMEQIGNTTGDSPERRELFRAFSAELRAHAAAEEHAFYAELLKETETTDQSRHSVAEHQEALDIVEELEQADMSSAGWLNRFNTLVHDNEHHMVEEEEEVFPLARKHVSDSQLDALLQVFDERKAQELDQLESSSSG